MNKELKNSNLRAFGVRLVELREHLHKSQKQMAGALDILPQTLNRYEKGEREAKQTFIEKIIAVTKCNPYWLFFGKGEMMGGPKFDFINYNNEDDIMDEFIDIFYPGIDLNERLELKKIFIEIREPVIRLEVSQSIIIAHSEFEKYLEKKRAKSNLTIIANNSK